MSKSKIYLILIALLLTSAAAQTFAQTVPPKDSENKLIAVLKSGSATHKQKSDACRELSFIATKNSVPTLAALLTDDKLAHTARYALETINDPSVDVALRDALGKGKGSQLVGVIGSIGVRRDEKAVPALIKLLNEKTPHVTETAARSLGDIGNAQAAKGLQVALKNAPEKQKHSLCEGLFTCAESMSAKGDDTNAIAIYDLLLKTAKPHQIRGGALRGAILARKKQGLPLLKKHLLSNDYILFSAAAQTAQELPGQNVTKILTDTLPQLSADNQIIVMQTLGKRGDPLATPPITAIALKADKSARIAAIETLAELSAPSAVPVLVQLLNDSDGDISRTSRTSLSAMPGKEIDTAVIAMLNGKDTKSRMTALELIASRRMTASIPTLLKTTSDTDAKVRASAIRKVGELGTQKQLPALLEILTNCKTQQDLVATEQTLRDICTRGDNQQANVSTLIALLPRTDPAQKGVILRVLSTLGGKDALKAVRAAVEDSNAEVHSAAIRALGTWNNTDAAEDLLQLAKTADNPKDKTLCLRAYLSLARRRDIGVSQRLNMCRQAKPVIKNTTEKRMLLGALGSIDSPQALAVITPYLDHADSTDEAAAACIAIAERLLKARNSARQTPKLIAPLQKVTQSTNNPDLKRRSQALLRQAKNKAPK